MKKSHSDKLIDWFKNHCIFSFIIAILLPISIILSFTSNLGSSWFFFKEIIGIGGYRNPNIDSSLVQIYYGLTGTTAISFPRPQGPPKSCNIGPLPITLFIDNGGEHVLEKCTVEIIHSDNISINSNDITIKSINIGPIDGIQSRGTSFSIGKILPESTKKIHLLVSIEYVVSVPKFEFADPNVPAKKLSSSLAEKLDSNSWEQVHPSQYPKYDIIILDSNGCPKRDNVITAYVGEEINIPIIFTYTPGPSIYNMWVTISARGLPGKTTKFQIAIGELSELKEIGFPIYDFVEGSMFKYKSNSN